MKLPVYATAILLALAAPAAAEVVTIEYEATMPAGTNWPAGVVVTGTITYDTNATPTSVNATEATYPLISGVAELNGEPFSGGPNNFVDVVNDFQFNATQYTDIFTMQVTNGTQPLPFAGVNVLVVAVDFAQNELSPPAVLTSVAPPGPDTDLDAFTTRRRVYVLYTDGGIGLRQVEAPISDVHFVADDPPILSAACEGFKAPFAKPVTLPRKLKLPILLRATLLDEDDNELGPETILDPPVVTVSYNGPVPFAGRNPNDFVASVVRPSAGNAFVWHDASTTRIRSDVNEWQFALDTRPYSQPGMYTVSVAAGAADYAISPTCTQTFVRK